MTFDRDRVWRALEEQERTMAWLARKLGISRECVRQVRAGERPGSARFWSGAAAVLRLSEEHSTVQ